MRDMRPAYRKGFNDMSLLEAVVNWTNKQTVECHNCNHPAKACSGGCRTCLDEIHYWYNSRKINRRTCYSCETLVYEYVKSYTERYYHNIISACNSIDFDAYGCFRILSIGCGASPDLMAFEELAKGKEIFYRGIDKIEQWLEFQNLIRHYVQNKNIIVDFQQSDVFNPVEWQKSTEIFNVAIMQYLISSIWGDSDKNFHRSIKEKRVKDLFKGFVDTVLLRWKNSNYPSPFLIILNDNDNVSTGRKQFYDLLDILVDRGYQGSAFVKSAYAQDDMNDRQNRGFDGFNFQTSSAISNNSATLTIEVIK